MFPLYEYDNPRSLYSQSSQYPVFMLQYEPMVEKVEFQNRCAYCVNGECTNPKVEEERNKLEGLTADTSISLEQLNRRINQSIHIKNLATRLDMKNDEILDLTDVQKAKITNETIMEDRKKIQFSFSCFAHPRRNPCNSRKTQNNT